MYVADFDDLCDEFDPWDELHAIKAKFPNFKCTLFAIPSRCSEELLAKYSNVPWIEIAAHGYHHSPQECLVWSKEEALAKLEELELHFVRVFRAPGWQLNEQVYEALVERDWIVADHAAFAWPSGRMRVRRYTYNLPGKKSIHGHTWDCMGNGPSNWLRLMEGVNEHEAFNFVSEAAEELDWGYDFPEIQDHVNKTEGARHANNITHIRINEILESEGDVTIADFGGWYGEAIMRCNRPDLCTLVEGWPPAVKSANSAGVKAICADLSRLPIEDNSFEWGVCSHTLEHIENITGALAELKRVCSKGLVVVVPIQTEEEFSQFPDHFHMADAKGWADMLGLETVDVIDGKEYVGVWRA